MPTKSMDITLLEKSAGLLCDVRLPSTTLKTRGVSQCGSAIYIKKSILRQKKNYGNSNISRCKKIIFKKSSKRNQNPSRNYYNSVTNLKFQHKPKNISFQKSSYENRSIII